MRQSYLIYCLNRPWAIQPDWLNRGLEILSRERDTAEHRQAIERAEEDRIERLKLVEARLGERTGWSHRVTVRDGIARIPVTGPISKYAGNFEDVSSPEMVSTERLAQEFHQAQADDSIKGILFDIDSPGGEAFGTSELSGMIHGARGNKPTAAYIDGAGASAAYWLASSVDDVWINKMGVAGSIGVYMACYDMKGMLEQKGIEKIEFLSSQSPNKRPDPKSDEGSAQIQQMIDDMAAVFVSDVARNRSVAEKTVLDSFGGGKVFVGTSAVEAGLVDSVGTYEEALESLKSKVSAQQGGIGARSMSDKMTVGERTLALLGISKQQAALPVDPETATQTLVTGELQGVVRQEDLTKLRTELEAKLSAAEAKNMALELQLKAIKDEHEKEAADAADNAAKGRVEAFIGKKLPPAVREDTARYNSLVAYAKLDPEGFDKTFESMADLPGIKVQGFAHTQTSEDATELNAAEEKLIAEEAEKTGKKKEDIRAMHIKVKKDRHSRMFLGN